MIDQPDDCQIKHALEVSALSPCRSKRGVVLWSARTGAHRGQGYNGPPAPLTCPGRERCAGNCGLRSVHAEVRALRDAEVYRTHHESGPFELLHVELAADGGVVACGGPSCITCAREILYVGFVAGVWLYEESVRRCMACRKFEDSSRDVRDRHRRCDHCGAVLTPIIGWRRYTAEEFYRVTLENCGVRP